MQLTGRAKNKEEREKILRKLSGIKEPASKRKKGKESPPRAPTKPTLPRQWGMQLIKSMRPPKAEAKHAAKGKLAAPKPHAKQRRSCISR